MSSIARRGARKAPRLLAQAESLNNLAIPIRVAAVEVVQEPAALVDHHDQPAPRGVILYVGLEDRKSTRLNSSHIQKSRMPSSA